MIERVQQLVIEAGLNWAAGNAVISIFGGDLENAAASLDLARGGMEPLELRHVTPERNEPIMRSLKTRNGVTGKKCDTCGEIKARQAFKAGSGTCRKCEKTG